MLDISRKTSERNSIEIVDNDGILWWNEKHIEEELDHQKFQEITTKYHSDHRKHRYELVTEPKKEYSMIFIDEKLAIKVIMDCRTRLGFKWYNVVLIKEQSVLTEIMSLFEGENNRVQCNVLSYRIDIYFHDYKLAIDKDENEHSNKNIDDKIKRQKAIKQEIGC